MIGGQDEQERVNKLISGSNSNLDSNTDID